MSLVIRLYADPLLLAYTSVCIILSVTKGHELIRHRIWHNWRHKQTDGLPGTMMFLWALSESIHLIRPPPKQPLTTLGAVPFGIYSIVQNFSIPLQIQPQIFCALVLVSWAQTLIYHKFVVPDSNRLEAPLTYNIYSRWRTWTATLTAVVTGLIFGAVEAGLTLALRVSSTPDALIVPFGS